MVIFMLWDNFWSSDIWYLYQKVTSSGNLSAQLMYNLAVSFDSSFQNCYVTSPSSFKKCLYK